MCNLNTKKFVDTEERLVDARGRRWEGRQKWIKGVKMYNLPVRK